MDAEEPKRSIEECKRIINNMPVEYARILDFILKIEHELQELEKRKEKQDAQYK